MILPYPKKNSNSHSDWFFDPQLLASTSHLSSPVDMPYITPNVSVDNHFVRSPTQLDYQSNHISPEPYSGVPIFVSSVSHLPSPNSPQMVSPSHLNPMHMQYMGTSPVPSNNSYVLSPTPSHQYNTQIENSPSYYPEPFEYSSFNDFLNDISPVSFQSDIQTFESRYPIEEDNVSQCQKRHQNIDMLQSDEQNQTWTCPVEGCQKGNMLFTTNVSSLYKKVHLKNALSNCT
ncbi:hypothetical protein HDV02_000826 [Globomyces sp. JEL0801]|nr:hypothetical protein HDV02_000826 [Globomyces sp. JEL0801]